MKIANKPQQWQVGSILGIGVLAVSTAAIFIRLSTEAAGVRGVEFSLFLAASRLIIAAIALLPAWKQLIQTQVLKTAYYYATGAGLCLAVHFATWISSLSYTSIAASTTIVTTNPIWVSLLSWIWFKDKPTKLTALGIAVALVGGIFITVADKNVGGNSSNPLLGDLLALFGAWMASLYLILGREAQRSGLNISSYITVAYSVAAIVLLPLPWLFGTGYIGYPNLVYVYVFLMAILSQLIGHTSFNWAVRWISPTFVTLVLLFEPISSSFLGFVLFKEVPPALVLLGGVILLVGVAIAILGAKNKRL
ncbi:MAG: DMT family transporter [Hydrococcus sp. Prado102]|jgi:drug/metabolite transporter (DMT)-like permease|nr:DMT family transporter [Hydrococcus sp. Prado102]